MEAFGTLPHEDFNLPIDLTIIENRGTEGSFSQTYVVPLIRLTKPLRKHKFNPPKASEFYGLLMSKERSLDPLLKDSGDDGIETLKT